MTENEQERVYVLYCTCGGVPITEAEFEQIKFILFLTSVHLEVKWHSAIGMFSIL